MTDENSAVRRRRQCISCGYRFTTYEKVEEPAVFVIKKDNRRERFERNKIMEGIRKACQKRNIGEDQIDVVVGEIERQLKNSPDREVSSLAIGTRIMDALKDLDHVAYVRFASVYKEFEDIGGFQKILEGLMKKKGPDGVRDKDGEASLQKLDAKR